MSDLRRIIREILTEEIGQLHMKTPPRHPPVTEERVSIRSNADLAEFVARLMTIAQDGRLRTDIAAGRYVFRLGEKADHSQQIQAHQPLAPNPGAPGVVGFETGLIGERQITDLPVGVRRITVGKTVRFTPLAKDELRRRGISIERSAS